MAPGKYRIWARGHPLLMHEGDDLQKLIERAQRHHLIFGDDYEVRTTSGKIVWTSKEGEEHEEAGMGRI